MLGLKFLSVEIKFKGDDSVFLVSGNNIFLDSVCPALLRNALRDAESNNKITIIAS